MAVFPFTIRATDSEGSFSDRTFNITVRNSKVERYMLITDTDAYTSSDAQSWTARVGMGGQSCVYGNGFWLVAHSNYIRKSFDGVNWSYVPAADIQVTDSETGTVISWPALYASQKIYFLNGKFYTMMRTITSSVGTYLWVLSSVDGLAWTKTPIVPGVNGLVSTSTSSIPLDGNNYYEFSSDGSTILINNNFTSVAAYGFKSEDNGATWQMVKDIAKPTGLLYSSVLFRVNGLWIAANNVTADGKTYVYSTDGSNWTTGTFTTNAFFTQYGRIVNIFYANGKLYAFTGRNGANTTYSYGYPMPYLTSTDGINWTSNDLDQYYAGTSSSASFVNNASYLYRNGVFIAAPTATPTPAKAGARVSFDGTTWAITNAYGGNTTFNDIAAM